MREIVDVIDHMVARESVIRGTPAPDPAEEEEEEEAEEEPVGRLAGANPGPPIWRKPESAGDVRRDICR